MVILTEGSKVILTENKLYFCNSTETVDILVCMYVCMYLRMIFRHQTITRSRDLKTGKCPIAS